MVLYYSPLSVNSYIAKKGNFPLIYYFGILRYSSYRKANMNTYFFFLSHCKIMNALLPEVTGTGYAFHYLSCAIKVCCIC